MFENQSHIDELKAVRDEYFNADSERKAELREEFADIQKRMLQATIDQFTKQPSKRYELLYRWAPFKNESTDWFDPEWMFGINNGFDIVIGNPPYVSVKSISAQQKDVFRKLFRCAQGRFNLFTLMIEKAKSCLKTGGILSFIQPEGLFTNVDYRHIRKILVNEGHINKIIMFDKRVFEAAVDTAILLFVNQKSTKPIEIIKNLHYSVAELPLSSIINSDDYLIQVSLNNDNAPIINKLNNCNAIPLERLL